MVSSREYHRARPDILLLAITSQKAHAGLLEVDIQHWEHARLIKPSVFKPLVTTVERHLILKKLGQLHADDRIVLEMELGELGCRDRRACDVAIRLVDDRI